jgi:hypothetical protein
MSHAPIRDAVATRTRTSIDVAPPVPQWNDESCHGGTTGDLKSKTNKKLDKDQSMSRNLMNPKTLAAELRATLATTGLHGMLTPGDFSLVTYWAGKLESMTEHDFARNRFAWRFSEAARLVVRELSRCAQERSRWGSVDSKGLDEFIQARRLYAADEAARHFWLDLHDYGDGRCSLAYEDVFRMDVDLAKGESLVDGVVRIATAMHDLIKAIGPRAYARIFASELVH